jgi:hypothetical protein
MGDEIAYLTAEFAAIAAAIAAEFPNADQRWALVVYRDTPDTDPGDASDPIAPGSIEAATLMHERERLVAGAQGRPEGVRCGCDGASGAGSRWLPWPCSRGAAAR